MFNFWFRGSVLLDDVEELLVEPLPVEDDPLVNTALSSEQPDDIDISKRLVDGETRYFDPYIAEHQETFFGSSIDDDITVLDESGAGLDASYFLGDGDDTIDDTSGREFFAGMDGDDVINSGSGSDRVFGGDGDDLIVNESELGLINGNDGNDTIFGGNDNDNVGGGSGDDAIYGGAGNDALSGHDGADYLSGGSGDDLLAGTYLNGPGSSDSSTGIDTLDGGDGNDILIMNRGEVGTGGDGNDQFRVAGTGSLETPVAHIEDFQSGVDTLELYYRASAGSEHLIDVSYDPQSDLTSVFLDDDLIVTLAGSPLLSAGMINLHGQYY
ncbi:calcium-binding protein [Sulfitobacter sp.]|uniref:calcium-binding protein n=1 Tax=Sulfitobacter sp. TaxID=1903071 RepID=UPI00300233AD